jgi:hypothetical protein
VASVSPSVRLTLGAEAPSIRRVCQSISGALQLALALLALRYSWLATLATFPQPSRATLGTNRLLQPVEHISGYTATATAQFRRV